MDIKADLRAALHIVRKRVAVEMEPPMRAAPVNQLQQKLLLDDINLCRIKGVFLLCPRKKHTFCRSFGIRDEADALAAAKERPVHADCRQLAAGGRVRFKGRTQVKACRNISAIEDDRVLRYIADIGALGRQRLHATAVFADTAVMHAEGGQKAQSAGGTRHVPILAAAEMIEKRLVVALHDDADIPHARVCHRGKRIVNEAVARAEGEGRACAVRDELAQCGIGVVSVDNAVQIGHQAFLLSA